MFRLFPIVIIIQAYCMYHAYTHKTEQKWYWIIILFPFLGSVYYLYHSFYSKNNIAHLKEGVKHTLVSNFKIDKLEKVFEFSDTFTNRMALADEHFLAQNYLKAQELYTSCNKGMNKNDPDVLLNIIKSSFVLNDHENVVKLGNQLSGKKEFLNSEERSAFAWSNYHLDKIDIAEKNFQAMDIKFSNYENRMEYAYFLELVGKIDQSKSLLQSLSDEIDSMDDYEKRLKNDIYKQIKSLQNR